MSEDLDKLRRKVVLEATSNSTKPSEVPGKIVVQLEQPTLDRLQSVKMPWEDDNATIRRLMDRDKHRLALGGESKPQVSSALYMIDHALNPPAAVNDLAWPDNWPEQSVPLPEANKVDSATRARALEVKEMESRIDVLVRTGRPIHKHQFLGLLWAHNHPMVGGIFSERLTKATGMAVEAPKGFHEAMYEVAIRAEYFMFGDVNQEVVIQDGLDRFKMMKKFDIRYPYPMSIYHALIAQDGGYKGQAMQVILDTRQMGAGGIPGFQKYPGHVIIAEYALVAKDGPLVFAPMRGTAVNMNAGHDAVEYDVIYCNTVLDRKDTSPNFVPVTVLASAYLNMALHVKNIPMERVEVSEKLAKARAKNRQPKLYPYTIVRTDTYEKAKAETRRMESMGHRTSPCMHTRRGHPRYYKNKVLPTWIHETIVNVNATEVVQREAYKVKRK